MPVKHTFTTKDGPTTKTLTRGKAIRAKCMDCSAWSFKEVKLCPVKDCALYPYRLGKEPKIDFMTERP